MHTHASLHIKKQGPFGDEKMAYFAQLIALQAAGLSQLVMHDKHKDSLSNNLKACYLPHAKTNSLVLNSRSVFLTSKVFFSTHVSFARIFFDIIERDAYGRISQHLCCRTLFPPRPSASSQPRW
jgi:hypothetical protein